MRVFNLLLVVALSLAGCGKSEAPEVAPTPPPAAAAAPTPDPLPLPGPATSEPRFRPMGMPGAPASGAQASGKRLVGTLAKSETPPPAGSAQATLVNRTSMTLDLYVDGGYGCRALKNLMCTTQVTPGTRTLEVRGPNGESATETVLIETGSSFTWTITEE